MEDPGADEGLSDPEPVDPAAIEELLARGDVHVHGRIAGSSNATLLVTCSAGGSDLLAVYKPVRGERPLWDFPAGLHRREVAAYELDRQLGFGLVPETVLRHDGPFGPGSCQRVVPVEDDSHYFTLLDDTRWKSTLRRLAVFDVIANNADRKSGHVLLAEDRLWAIDHGLTFHSEDKLRTVIWDFVGEEPDGESIEALERLVRDGPAAALTALLDADELEAMDFRAQVLLATRRLPEPDSDRPYPWPLV